MAENWTLDERVDYCRVLEKGIPQFLVHSPLIARRVVALLNAHDKLDDDNQRILNAYAILHEFLSRDETGRLIGKDRQTLLLAKISAELAD